MVRISTTLTLLCLALALQSQITIQYSDIDLFGVKAIQSMDTLPDPSIHEGGLGMMAWDFSKLKADVDVQLEFVDPATTPKGSEFPQSNICMVSDSLAFAYLSIDEQAMKLLGLYGILPSPFDTSKTIELVLRFQPAQSVLRFPATFGQSYDETVRTKLQFAGGDLGLPFDSVRLESTTERIVSIDAFGELTTPTGTYEVIRSSELELSWDTSYIYYLGTWQVADAASEPDSVYNFNFWTNASGLGFPVVQLQLEPEFDFRSASWLKDFTLSTAEYARQVAIEVWPNPAAGQLYVSSDDPRPGTIEIFDMNGRLFTSRSWDGQRGVIDVSQLPTGTHLLTLKDQSGRMIGFKLFQKL